MDRQDILDRAGTRGVNPVVYWPLRAVLQPFFHLYFRLDRIGREHIPADGPVILASNHRSFLDPFVIAVMARRPVSFVAKKELFDYPFCSRILSALGAFPIVRGRSDQDAMDVAKAILARGEPVLIFPEGTRIRPGAPARAKRGVGRLALETGAPVVPIAVIGTEAVRDGWRIRPRKVRIRAGRPLTFPRVAEPSSRLAAAVTDRIWPCVELQWEWLGGLPRMRRAAVIGAGTWGTRLAAGLARAGLEVDLVPLEPRGPVAGLADVELPDAVRPVRSGDLELQHHDLVCFAVPADELPAAVAAHGDAVPERAGVLVASGGLVPPLGTPPSAYVAQHVRARAIASLGDPAGAPAHGASPPATGTDGEFLAELNRLLAAAGVADPVNHARRSRAA